MQQEEGGGRAAQSVAHAKRLQRDSDLLEALIKNVIPRAVHLYLEAPQVTLLLGFCELWLVL